MKHYIALLIFLCTGGLAHAGHFIGEQEASAILSTAASPDLQVSDWLNQNGRMTPNQAVSQGQQMQAIPSSMVNVFQVDQQSAAPSDVPTSHASDVTEDWYCPRGDCGDRRYVPSTAFGTNSAKLLGLLQAGQRPTNTTMQLFEGNQYRCHESSHGYNNCCAQTGWGHDLGLAGCNSEEKQLAKLRSRRLCVYVGHYCASKVMKRCVRHRQSWCCYTSPLARLIQQQGHVQLNWSYGHPKHPVCRGFSLSDFARLDFDKINFAEIAADIQRQVPTVNTAAMQHAITTHTVSQRGAHD